MYHCHHKHYRPKKISANYPLPFGRGKLPREIQANYFDNSLPFPYQHVGKSSATNYRAKRKNLWELAWFAGLPAWEKIDFRPPKNFFMPQNRPKIGYFGAICPIFGPFFPIFPVRPKSIFGAFFSDFGRRPEIDFLPGRQTR